MKMTVPVTDMPPREKSADAVEKTLHHRGVRPTAIRILVLRAMRDADCALSLTDIEEILGTVDRSTVFRTLSTFLTKHIVHAVNDGSGQLKYALCPDSCHCHEADNPDFNDLHAHFYCVKCHKTFCLRGMPVPAPHLGDGFVVESASYIVSGLCPHCAPLSK